MFLLNLLLNRKIPPQTTVTPSIADHSANKKTILRLIEEEAGYTDSTPVSFGQLKQKLNPLIPSLWTQDKEDKTPTDNIFHCVAKINGTAQLTKWLIDTMPIDNRQAISEKLLLQTNHENKTPLEIAIEFLQNENFKILLKELGEIYEYLWKFLLQAMLAIPKETWNDNREKCQNMYDALCDHETPDLFALENRRIIDWNIDHPFARYALAKTYSTKKDELKALPADSALIIHDLTKASVCIVNLQLLLQIYEEEGVKFKISLKFICDFLVNVILKNFKDPDKCVALEDVLKQFLINLDYNLKDLNRFIKHLPQDSKSSEELNAVALQCSGNIGFSGYLKQFFRTNYSSLQKARESLKTLHDDKAEPISASAAATLQQIGQPEKFDLFAVNCASSSTLTSALANHNKAVAAADSKDATATLPIKALINNSAIASINSSSSLSVSTNPTRDEDDARSPLQSLPRGFLSPPLTPGTPASPSEAGSPPPVVLRSWRQPRYANQ